MMLARLGGLCRRAGGAALVSCLLVTILTCALAPQGLPRTVSQGSAFNPATTSVALHVQAPRERSAIERLLPAGGPEDGVSSGGGIAAEPLAFPTLAAPAPTAAPLAPAFARAAPHASPRTRPEARAPPVA